MWDKYIFFKRTKFDFSATLYSWEVTFGQKLGANIKKEKGQIGKISADKSS